MWIYWGLVAVFGILMIFSAGTEMDPEVVSETILQGSRISADNEFQMEKKQGQERE